MNPTAAIHVGKAQLGLDEDTYRDLLQLVTGKRSAKDMTPAEREKVLDEMRRRGFDQGRLKGRRKPLEGKYARKLQALWIAGWNLGIIRNRDDRALIEFVDGRTGIQHPRWLHHADDGKKAVEALKGWLARDGGVAWGSSNGYDFLTHDNGKIAWAQYRKLVPGATLMGNRSGFYREVMAIAAPDAYDGMPIGMLKPAHWRTVMNAFGERIRKAKR